MLHTLGQPSYNPRLMHPKPHGLWQSLTMLLRVCSATGVRSSSCDCVIFILAFQCLEQEVMA
eukprot:1067585-Amphidinium_carterae.1